MPHCDGKITAQQINQLSQNYFSGTNQEHEVEPGAVYLSQPTEFGTLYTLHELQEIRKTCDECNLTLFVDGARLGYALASPANDVSLQDLAELCHVFYIGGTKCAALCGEAVVIHPQMSGYFRNMMKQTCGILAKGRLLGIQFLTLFEENGKKSGKENENTTPLMEEMQEEMQTVSTRNIQQTLYVEVCKNAVLLALRIREAFDKKQIPLHIKSNTNQQFPILTQAQVDYFAEKFSFEHWENLPDTRTVVRFCCSWATKEEDVALLLEAIAQCPC